MPIQKNMVVSLEYEMFDSDNHLLDKTEEPLQYLHGGYDGIFPLVEEALQDKDIDSVIDIKLEPDDAFGEIEDDLIHLEPLANLPEEAAVGMVLETDETDEDALLFRITDIAEGQAVLDANHPLAGQMIRFIAKVVGIRAASSEEIEHGHVHDGTTHAHH